MQSPKNTKNTKIDRRPSLLSIMELLHWTLNDWGMEVQIDKSHTQVYCLRNSEKVIIWPRNKNFVEPIEKMKILVWCQSGLHIFSLKKVCKGRLLQGGTYSPVIWSQRNSLWTPKNQLSINLMSKMGLGQDRGFSNSTATKIPLLKCLNSLADSVIS